MKQFLAVSYTYTGYLRARVFLERSLILYHVFMQQLVMPNCLQSTKANMAPVKSPVSLANS